MQNKDYYSPSEALEFLNEKFHLHPPVNLARLGRLRRLGRIKGTKIGGMNATMYTHQSLDAVTLQEIQDRRSQTKTQIEKLLSSVGACFAFSNEKFVHANDEYGSKPSYHIHPDCSHPHQDDIIRIESIAQLQDWVRTQKAAKAAKSDEAAFDIQQAYQCRWE